MEKLITVKNVEKHFGDTAALKDLSFDVNDREIFGFLGPSGAGKTTTIKLLTHQLKQDQGIIQIFSHPVEEMTRDDDDRIGILSDNSGAYERLTVYDNLLFFAELKNVDKAVIDEVLADVGLTDARKKSVKALSRGMKQRLMLAQAIMHKPKLLFLDEPTASLDPGTSMDIHNLLRRLNENGTTIFLTTHDMEEADKLCDRLAFLNNGEIIEQGTPEELKLKYANDQIIIKLSDGEIIESTRSLEDLNKAISTIKSESISTIHSQEPNLEDVFLKVTGRKLS